MGCNYIDRVSLTWSQARRAAPASSNHIGCGVFLDADKSYFDQWKGACTSGWSATECTRRQVERVTIRMIDSLYANSGTDLVILCPLIITKHYRMAVNNVALLVPLRSVQFSAKSSVICMGSIHRPRILCGSVGDATSEPDHVACSTLVFKFMAPAIVSRPSPRRVLPCKCCNTHVAYGACGVWQAPERRDLQARRHDWEEAEAVRLGDTRVNKLNL